MKLRNSYTCSTLFVGSRLCSGIYNRKIGQQLPSGAKIVCGTLHWMPVIFSAEVNRSDPEAGHILTSNAEVRSAYSYTYCHCLVGCRGMVFNKHNYVYPAYHPKYNVTFNLFYEITNRCSYMQSILFHC